MAKGTARGGGGDRCFLPLIGAKIPQENFLEAPGGRRTGREEASTEPERSEFPGDRGAGSGIILTVEFLRGLKSPVPGVPRPARAACGRGVSSLCEGIDAGLTIQARGTVPTGASTVSPLGHSVSPSPSPDDAVNVSVIRFQMMTACMRSCVFQSRLQRCALHVPIPRAPWTSQLPH